MNAKRSPRRSAVGSALALVAAGTAFFLAAPARAEEATIRVSPPRTQVGHEVLVVGRHFTAGAEVTLSMSEVDGREGQEVARTQVDETGAIHTRVAVPDVPPGEYAMKAATSEQVAVSSFSVAATYRCLGHFAPIVGTSGDDVLHGTQGDDVIVGRAGNDVLLGMGGHDRICGDAGNDEVRSDDGGGLTADALSGGSGDDLVVGGAGSDILEGGSGNDTLSGQGGGDQLFGGGGSDHLFGDAVTSGDDLLDGGPGFDFCIGGFSGSAGDSFVNCEVVHQ
ncbi:MAG: calcium-binding protein [Acidimicrobiales bacterium]